MTRLFVTVGIIGMIIMIIIALVRLGILIKSAGDWMDDSAARYAVTQRPKYIAKCEKYGTAFDVQVKWDNQYGCLEKRSDGWAKVQDIR
jgi:hypothetical protein